MGNMPAIKRLMEAVCAERRSLMLSQGRVGFFEEQIVSHCLTMVCETI